MTSNVDILWLTPDKPANISVGRRRIADHLESSGYTITLRGTTVKTIVQSSRELGKYDVIIGTTRAGAIGAVWLKALYQCPVIVDHIDPIGQFEDTHPSWLSVPVRLGENLSFAVSDHVLYVYKEEEQRVRKFASNATKTNLGVEADQFTHPAPTTVSAVEERLRHLDLNEKIAVYIGGLEPIYHVEELLDAMVYLPSWSLVLIGDGSLRARVNSRASQRQNIHYLGTVPHKEIPAYLHAVDVGVSLVDDPHTLKILEYGAAGLPVVQLAGDAEDRFGELLTYTDSDPRHIAEAIESTSIDTTTSNLQMFVTKYDWKKIAGDYAQAIKNVI